MENRNRNRNETVFHDGFMYYTSKRSNGIRYVRCTKYPQTRCQATGTVDENGLFTVKKGHHNHHAMDDQIEGRNFKRILMEACFREKGDLKSIYDRLAMGNVEGALVVPYNSVRSSMQRWRRSTRPRIPVDLEDLSRVLETGEWPRYSQCNEGLFFSGLVRADGHSALIFGNEQFVGNFRESQYTFIDGTFKAVPRRPGFSQILTIFAICMDHAFPIFHIFMERRTRPLYDAIFTYLSGTFDGFRNKTIITDYESALVASLRALYPDASLKGCFFHFCQALLRQAKTLGVLRQIRGHINGRKLLRKYYALALLPVAMVEEAFNSLQGNNGELDNIFREFHNYVRRQWIQRDTPGHFSVFRQQHRTNNVMESYHRRLNSRLVRHPGIWDLMENLIEIQNIAILELEQLERQGRVFRVATRNIVFNTRLNEAWDKLEDGRFTIGDFLRQAVHFVANLDEYLEVQHEEDDAPADIPIPAPQAQPVLPLHVPVQNDPPPLIFFQPQGLQGAPVPQPNVPQPPPLIFNAPLNLPVPEHPPNPVLQPPPLIFFNAPPNPPEPAHPPNPVLHPPPLIFLNAPPNPPAPEHPPNLAPIPDYDFPEVDMLFDQLTEEEDRLFEENPRPQRHWEPRIPAVAFEEDSMDSVLRCNICYLNKVQYVMTDCGHASCTTCTDTLFNVQAKCGICRMELRKEPCPIFFN
ncbi:uncharacterized protein LOC115874674 [Sitophilus oryzae]|uniref:Uncharacterized protein LOC115874674 n=1 Tax=Sitophilus oryzae TaxID=7048 RepID=A0A6J2X3I0_SITOR|nr:uncharacterized protein LOC115874674 [Sitophilus oryzae]